MISIYDENINFIGIIEDYESLIFTRRFYKYGEFELYINKNKQYADKLQKFNIIALSKKEKVTEPAGKDFTRVEDWRGKHNNTKIENGTLKLIDKNIWRDGSGNGNDGQLTNFDFTEDSGWGDGGLKFDVVDDYVQLPDLALNPDDFAIQVDNKIRAFNGDKVMTENGDEWGRNLIVRESIQQGFANTNTGLPMVYINGITTKFILVEPGSYTLSCKNMDNARNTIINFDLDKVKKGSGGWNNQEERAINITETSYLVISVIDDSVPLDSPDSKSKEEYMKFYSLKLEKGSTATPWTPAPEDITETNIINHNTPFVENNTIHTLRLYNRALTDEEIMQNYQGNYSKDGLVLDLNPDTIPTKGTFITEPIDISSTNIAKGNTVSWQGEGVKVESSISLNGGRTWSEWQEVNNTIPQIADGTDVAHGRLKYKITLTRDTVDEPYIRDLTTTIETKDIEIIRTTIDPKKAGIILHREIGLDEEGEPSEDLFIKGYTLDGLTKFREIVPDTGQAFVSFEGSQESIMKGFVNNCIVNPSDADRRMNMINAPNQNRGKQDRWRGRFENLADKLEEIGLYSELGWEVSLDIENRRFIFDVVQGIDRTANQSNVAPALFSMDFNNIASRQYVESAINSNNVIYAGGSGDYEDKLIQKVGTAQGIKRIEGYADFSNISDISELKTLGEQKLKELAEIETFEATVIPDNSFYYGEDYDLGDYVTVIDKSLNRKLDTQIIEIKEIRDENGSTIEVVFGNNIPTIIDQIKELKKQEKPLDLSKGTPGKDGEGLDFTWNGTQLGVKKENDTQYVYVNLVGPPGPEGPQGPPGKQGIQGLPGIDGKSIEFHWNGTQLGVRVEGQTKYQYVDLKGNKGDTGATGKSIEFNWNGTQLGVRQEGDIEYVYVDLKGDKGDKGPKGEPGKDGKSIEFQWSGTSLGIRLEGESEFRYVNLKGEKGDVGPQGPPGKDGSDAEVTKDNVINAIGYTPVDKTGDTMTGPLALTGSIFDTEFKADNWNLINKYTGGGWARGLLNVKNKDGTNYIQIGGLGSGQNFTRLYIGKAWNDWLLGVNPNNNTVEIQGNLTKNNKEVATKDEIPTKLSELEMDIDIDKSLVDTGDNPDYTGVKYEIVVKNGKPYLKVVSN